MNLMCDSCGWLEAEPFANGDSCVCGGVFRNGEWFLERFLDSLRESKQCLQMLVDSVVSLQATFPMPHDGWQAFIRDIEYTNHKHGINLQVPNLDNRAANTTEPKEA